MTFKINIGFPVLVHDVLTLFEVKYRNKKLISAPATDACSRMGPLKVTLSLMSCPEAIISFFTFQSPAIRQGSSSFREKYTSVDILCF